MKDLCQSRNLYFSVAIIQKRMKLLSFFLILTPGSNVESHQALEGLEIIMSKTEFRVCRNHLKIKNPTSTNTAVFCEITYKLLPL